MELRHVKFFPNYDTQEHLFAFVMNKCAKMSGLALLKLQIYEHFNAFFTQGPTRMPM